MSKPIQVVWAEDDKQMRRSYQTWLNAMFEDDFSLEVHLCIDGQHALEKIAELQKNGTPVQLLITDRAMPRMNGIQLLLRRETSNIPHRLMVSGDDKRACQNALKSVRGNFQFIEKMDFETLNSAIRKALTSIISPESASRGRLGS